MRVTVRLKSAFFLGLIAAVGGLATVTWRQWRELEKWRATAMREDERANFEAKLAEIRRRNRDLQVALAALRSGSVGTAKILAEGAAEEARRLASLAVAGEDLAASKRDEDLELLAAMADLPEFQRVLALQQRGKIEAKYADLFRKLKLAPAELARMQTLLADRQNAFADAMLAARDQGLSGKEARRVAGEVARATQKELTNDLNQLLGPRRFNELQSYERNAPQRETVSQIAQRLSYTATPLTPAQSDQLVQLLATSGAPKPAPTNRRKPPADTARPAEPVAALPGSVAGLGIGSTNTVIVSSAALAQAQTFLSPQQITVLQRLQEEQQAQQMLGSLLRNGTVTPPAKPGKIK